MEILGSEKSGFVKDLPWLWTHIELQFPIKKKKKRQSNIASWCPQISGYASPLWSTFQRNWAFANPPTVTAILNAHNFCTGYFRGHFFKINLRTSLASLFHGNVHRGHIGNKRFTPLLIPMEYLQLQEEALCFKNQLLNTAVLALFPVDAEPSPQMMIYSMGNHKSLSITCGYKYSFVEWQPKQDVYLKCTDDGSKARRK